MATTTRLYWTLQKLTGGDYTPAARTVVQVSWPVPRVADSSVPETVMMRTVEGVIDSTGRLVDGAGTEGLEILDPNDDTVQPNGYVLTVRVIPRDGDPAWSAYAKLSNPRTGGGYDLADNMTGVDPKGQQWFTGKTGASGQGITIQGHVTTAPDDLPDDPTVSDAYIADDTGHLWVYGATGWIDAGAFQGPKGDTGPAGSTGPKGDTGSAGPTGVGVASANVDGSGNLSITLTDSTVEGPWNVKGPKGDTGATGDTGAAGDPTAYELRGDGSPYGVVTPSEAGITYTDRQATTGARQWMSTGTTNTSWIVVVGDTGWRDVTGSLNAVSGYTWPSGCAFLRRTGAQISFVFGIPTSGTSPGVGVTVIYLIPTGFRFPTPNAPTMRTMGSIMRSTTTRSGGTSKTLFLEMDSGDAASNNAVAADLMIGASSAGVLDWTTADPWPTTLPGTAI